MPCLLTHGTLRFPVLRACLRCALARALARNVTQVHGMRCMKGGVAGGHAEVEALAHSEWFEEKGNGWAGTLTLSA